VQLIAFAMFFLFVIQFMVEFNDQGMLYYSSIPLWGNDLTQLAGVVLFNYAYPITVPSWLNEKQTHVRTSHIIWGASTLATTVYLVFGIAGASAFLKPGADMLQLLSSNQVSVLTRMAAALFSLLIIGSGAPIFCVIIHKSLYDDDVLSEKASLFVGAVLPYILSLLMYQGTLLMVGPRPSLLIHVFLFQLLTVMSILIIAFCFRLFPIISNHFQSFPIISNHDFSITIHSGAIELEWSHC
jgi:hypothetical protein